MIGAVARKLFGSSNDRRIRAYRPQVAAINALEAELEQLSDEALRARTDAFKKQLAEGATLDDILVPAFATVREAGKRTLGQRHFDVQLIGGMVLHEGKIAEMKTGEGKTLVATLAGLSQRAGRPRRARRHRQRLSGQTRLRMDGADLQVPRAHGRRHRPRSRRRAAQEGIRLRRHLRHQQRARLRLPARQHEVPARGHGAARAHLRHRRRGRFDPDRRGAHPADHFRSARRPFRVLQHHRRLHPQARQGRLRGRRETAHRQSHRSRHGKDGAGAARSRPAQVRFALRRRERLGRAPCESGLARAQAVPARQGLHRAQRRGRHHRRVHRPHDAGPALFGGPAPGARGQGAAADPAGEPDAGLDHLPELFPHVREARRHDRHGDHRGGRVPGHLQSRGPGNSHQHADDPPRRR